MRNVLVVGANGLVGSAVADEVAKYHDVVRTSRQRVDGHESLDAMDMDQVRRIVRAHQPGVIINTPKVIH